MKNYLFIFFFLMCGIVAHAQNNVGIGAADPAVSALLELRSSEKGLLVPRLTAMQRLAITNPANSLLVYDTDSACFFYYRSNVWKSLCSTALGTVGATGLQGVTGANGATGPQGIQGATGAQGNPGPQGSTGVTGVAGVNGATGPQGVQGPTGAAGANGATGLQGLQGATGAVGANGATGPQGLQGPTGATGANGITGPQGLQGPTGAAGANGATGLQGLQGATGAVGAVGANGATGPQGLQGPTGAAGANGATGVTGNTGATGPNWNITALTFNNAGMLSLTTDQPATFSTPQSAWLITGNAGTVDGTNFLGTTDDVTLNFRVNNQKAGRIERFQPAMGLGGVNKFGNTVLGYQALNVNTPQGHSNIAIGYRVLFTNTTGKNNIGVGGLSTLLNNTTGSDNIAVGGGALLWNTIGNANVAIGGSALTSNSTGADNVAVGGSALVGNKTGISNVAVGASALSIRVGDGNTAIGKAALASADTGSYNVAVGHYALGTNTRGSYHTAVGANALQLGNLLAPDSNNTAIGYDAQVPNNGLNNQVRIGNSFVTYAGIQVPWTITSDRNWKSEIKNTELGLEFIGKLRPVQYYRTNDVKKRTEYGFIAQEVEETLKQFGVTNSGVITVGDDGMYGLRYNDIIAPLVRGMQQQQEIIEKLNIENGALKAGYEELKRRLEALEKLK